MKRTYQKPSMELMQYNSEQVIAASLQIDIDNNTSIGNESEMWSNEESGLDIW